MSDREDKYQQKIHDQIILDVLCAEITELLKSHPFIKYIGPMEGIRQVILFKYRQDYFTISIRSRDVQPVKWITTFDDYEDVTDKESPIGTGELPLKSNPKSSSTNQG